MVKGRIPRYIKFSAGVRSHASEQKKTARTRDDKQTPQTDGKMLGNAFNGTTTTQCMLCLLQRCMFIVLANVHSLGGFPRRNVSRLNTVNSSDVKGKTLGEERTNHDTTVARTRQ